MIEDQIMRYRNLMELTISKAIDDCLPRWSTRSPTYQRKSVISASDRLRGARSGKRFGNRFDSVATVAGMEPKRNRLSPNNEDSLGHMLWLSENLDGPCCVSQNEAITMRIFERSHFLSFNFMSDRRSDTSATGQTKQPCTLSR